MPSWVEQIIETDQDTKAEEEAEEWEALPLSRIMDCSSALSLNEFSWGQRSSELHLAPVIKTNAGRLFLMEQYI